MAITNTKQAKEFTAGAPNIVLKGDLRPNQMMASSPSIEDSRNELSMSLFNKPIFQLTPDELEMLNNEAERLMQKFMADGGRAQYGLGSFVKSIGKGVKKAVKGVAKGVKDVAKSDLGKTALTAAALYYAPALFKGTPGFGPGSTYRNFFSNLGLPSLSEKGAGTLKAFAIGSLGSAALSAAEAGGLDSSDPNAEVDLESLQGYLSRGYKNLNPNATDEEVFQFVQENTAEYRADGGRIGFNDGTYTFEQFMKDKGKVDAVMGEQKMRKLYEEMMRKKKVADQKTMAAMGGRIGYGGGTSIRDYAMSMNSGRGPITLNDFIDVYKFAGYDDGTAGSLGKRHYKTGIGQDSNTKSFAMGGRIGFKEGKSKEFLGMDMTISKNPNDPRNMTTKEIVFAIQDNRSTPEMFEELMLRGVDGVSSMMIDEIGGKKLDKPQKVYQFNPREVKGGGVTEELLFRLRESNPDVYGEYSRPKKFIGFLAAPSLPRETPKSKAEGGRISYAMGDTASENAMQAAGIEGLPVRQNKAGVTELDLRETGGFVPPVGIKEKADDIPAMLSNNEFVFTADAVRAAGGGNINKGAQIMYDTMKKLESRVV